MIERHEGHFPGHAGLELFYQSWTPSPNETSATSSSKSKARPTLVITHGFAEHSECYRDTARQWSEKGWSVFAWDLRGHGRSEGKRGYVHSFDEYIADLSHFLCFLNSTGRLKGQADSGFILVGHSMGGLITLAQNLYGAREFARQGRVNGQSTEVPQPQALALSSPQLGLALEVPALKNLAAKLLLRTLPRITLFNELKYEDLTHDTQLLKGYPTDPLRHDKISPAVYFGMLENMNRVISLAPEVKLPILIQAAGQEKIVSLPEIKNFFGKLTVKNKQLHIYEKSYHEIFNDLERQQVFEDFEKFFSEF